MEALKAALFSLADYRNRTPGAGNLAIEVMRRGGVEFELYVPKNDDPQTPHARDELYVVASGRATLTIEGVAHACSTGDALFVAAGVEHRFTEFSADFGVWVLFF